MHRAARRAIESMKMNYEQMRANALLDYFRMIGRRPFGAARRPKGVMQNHAAKTKPLLRSKKLASGARITITDGVATTIRIDDGEVWITEQGSFIDHILRAGQSYALDRPGMALVSAQGEARITVFSPDVGMPPAVIDKHGGSSVRGRRMYARSFMQTVLAALMPSFMRRPATIG